MVCTGRALRTGKEGFARLEVALPSLLDIPFGSCTEALMTGVVIGVDPRKRLVTIEVMAPDEAVLDGGRYATDGPPSGRPARSRTPAAE